MDNVVIRQMEEGDLDVVSELAMLANPFAVKEKYRNHIFDELRENPDLSFVATVNGGVVGYVQADIHNATSTLEDIVIAEEHQMKGLGRMLLEKVLIILRNKKTKIILAEVHYKCSSAIPFYYKFGFRISGCVQDRFGVGHDAIIIKLDLE